ncbi:MAG TPA: peptidylprolyl isomerase [Candidatus Saccharimonadia bacterium]
MPDKNEALDEKDQPKTEAKAESKAKPEIKTAESKTPKDSPSSVAVAAKKLDPAQRASAKAKAMAGVVRSRSFRSTALKVGAVVVALLAIVVIVFGVLIYKYKSESPAVRIVSSIIPYPIEQVNGRFVSYNDYLFEVDANEKAYQNNAKLNNQPAVNFNSADGKKLVAQIKQHALDKLKNDAVTRQLADQKHVKVTDKEVNDLINQLYDRYGGKDTLLKTLNQIYGWNINDLKKVIRMQLLAKNLEDKVTSDPTVDAAAKAKAEDVLKKIKDGGDFAALAKQYSQASDAANGGDLGFFTKGQLPDNVQAAAEALQPDQVSDVIKTQYGYEILKVVEKKDDGSIHGMHILIKTIDFNDWFQQQVDKAKVTKYING